MTKPTQEDIRSMSIALNAILERLHAVQRVLETAELNQEDSAAELASVCVDVISLQHKSLSEVLEKLDHMEGYEAEET